MEQNDSWWLRPCGGIDVLRQAIPLIVSWGSVSLMNFTDRVFLAYLPGDSMTASFSGGMLFWTTVSLPMATAALVTTFVAQYHGSGNYHRIGRVVWQGIWFGFVMMPVFLLLFEQFSQTFLWFGHDIKLIELERTYYFYLLLGSAATISGEAAASFFRGQGKMHVEMFNNIFCVMLNIVLDYCLIFGHFGFPEWGLAGAAIATAFSQWVRFLNYTVLMYIHDHNAHKFHVLDGMVVDLPLMGRLCYYGIPSGLYTFTDTVTFTAFILIITGLGQVQRDATTIAFTLNSFTYIPINGIGVVVTSMVGNQLGQNRPDLARRATMTAQMFGWVYAGFFGIAFLVSPDVFLFPFAQSDEFAGVHDLSIVLLRFIALYLLFDSCAMIFCSTLRGAGDTIFIAWIIGISAPLMPVLCAVGTKFFGLGIIWCWSVLTALVIVYCIGFSLRYRSKVWESMRVIEKEYV